MLAFMLAPAVLASKGAWSAGFASLVAGLRREESSDSKGFGRGGGGVAAFSGEKKGVVRGTTYIASCILFPYDPLRQQVMAH
jgi:hypothetical protein